MMLAAALLLFVQSAPSAPADAPSDIVVTALRKLRISTQVADGKVKACQVRVSSGDADIDRTACEATVTCFNSGVTQSEPLADCVETKVVAFVRKKRDG